jgi:calcium-dependent protein kinase
VNQLASKDEF